MTASKRVEGIGHQIKGALMESLGVAIGDAKLAEDGRAEREVGDKLNAADVGGDQLAGVDTDRIIGVGRQIKGAVMEQVGTLAGNPDLLADGVKERNASVQQNIAGGERDLAREGLAREEKAP